MDIASLFELQVGRLDGAAPAVEFRPHVRGQLLSRTAHGGRTQLRQALAQIRILDGLDALTTHLDAQAQSAAAELLDAHRRVRSGAGAPRRGLDVRAETPVDIVGVYLLLPAISGAN